MLRFLLSYLYMYILSFCGFNKSQFSVQRKGDVINPIATHISGCGETKIRNDEVMHKKK